MSGTWTRMWPHTYFDHPLCLVHLCEPTPSERCPLCQMGWESKLGKQESCFLSLSLIHLFHSLLSLTWFEPLTEGLCLPAGTAVRESLRVPLTQPDWLCTNYLSETTIRSPSDARTGQSWHSTCHLLLPIVTARARPASRSVGQTLGLGLVLRLSWLEQIHSQWLWVLAPSSNFWGPQCEVLHLKSLFSGRLSSTWNHALLFHAPDKKKAPETTLLRPHAPLKLQLTVSFLLYSQTSREYWIPSLSPPPQPLFHLQPTVDLVSSWGIYQNCPCEVGHLVLSWFDFHWHFSSENMLSFGFCDMSQFWIFLLLLWSFLSWFLLSTTPLSNFFGWNYSEFCPRHSSYPILISQKITSTSLTLNTMRELRSYSRMTPLQYWSCWLQYGRSGWVRRSPEKRETGVSTHRITE